jgi:heme-degrading monooxygenase HmoA
MRRRGANAPPLIHDEDQMLETNGTTTSDQPFYRIDRFVVPDAAREEFLGRVRMTHTILRQQPGFVRDALLEHPAEEPGHSIVLTIAEWKNQAVTSSARAAVQALHIREKFDPQELFARLGIKAEFGNYRPLTE